MRKRKASFAFPFVRSFVCPFAQIHLLFVFQNDMHKENNKRRQTAQWENRWFRLSLSVCSFYLSLSLDLNKFQYGKTRLHSHCLLSIWSVHYAKRTAVSIVIFFFVFAIIEFVIELWTVNENHTEIENGNFLVLFQVYTQTNSFFGFYK